MQTCRAASATSAMPSSWGRLHLELVVCELLHSLHNGKADDILHKGQEGACRATSTASVTAQQQTEQPRQPHH